MSSSSSSSSSSTPTFSLSNGHKIPVIAMGCAFGQWVPTDDNPHPIGMLPELAYSSINDAFKVGYRHFDGAHVYMTERHVGFVLAQQFVNGLKREDIFITSKLGHPPRNPDSDELYSFREDLYCDSHKVKKEDLKPKIYRQLEKTLDDLGLAYLDLLLVHWPSSESEKDEKFARSFRYELWKIYESLYEQRLVKAIGVSNFTIKHIQQLLEDGAKIVPMVNQVEMSPYCQNQELIDFCKSKNIIIEAYSPLGSGALKLTEDPTLLKIASEVSRTVGQVVLRWLYQLGCVSLPRTSQLQRAKENLSIFDFELNEEQMNAVKALAKQHNKHTCPDPAKLL